MKNTVRKNIWENQNSSRVFCWIRLESPLDNKIKPVNPTGNQPWIFIGKTDAEAEAPIFWPSDAKRWLIGKDPDAGKDRRQEEKGPTDDERVGWHHRFIGHEFEQTPGDGEGTGKPGVLSPWGCKVRHDWATEQQEHVLWRWNFRNLWGGGMLADTWIKWVLWNLREGYPTRKDHPSAYISCKLESMPYFMSGLWEMMKAQVEELDPVLDQITRKIKVSPERSLNRTSARCER